MMPRLRTWFPLLSLAAATALLPACDDKDEEIPSIASIAVANPDFSVLEDAAVRGGVVGTLSNRNPQGDGNFTVFAPTNAAFARLNLRSAPDLLVLNREFLTNTLLYHVSNGTTAGSALQPSLPLPSLLLPAFRSSFLTRRIINRNGVLYVNGSRILQTDVRASNGVVHAIDKVLLATGGNIVESAQALQTAKVFVQPELTFLVEAVLHAGLASVLSDPQTKFTVFAPTDQAFRDLLKALNVPAGPNGYVPADVRKLPQDVVAKVLLHHALTTERFTPELPENTAAATAGGQPLTFGAFTDGVLTVRGNGPGAVPANMVIPDVQCTNGIVHVIDRVLLPVL